MKWIYLAGLFFVTFTVSCSNSRAQENKTVLEPQMFQQKMAELPDAPVIDVRTPEEFNEGTIERAVNINWLGNDFSKNVQQFDKNAPVFVYCLSGGRSASAAAKMREMGFREVYELRGGLLNWRKAGLEEAKDTQTTVGISLTDFHKMLEDKPLVLVDFYADWCQPCKKMQPFLDELARERSDELTLIRINADENPELCAQLGIEGLPVIRVYRNGEQSWSHMGYLEKAEIEEHLN